MSPRTSNEPERLSLSQSRHASMVTGMSNMAPRTLQDDELSSHDTSSLCSIPHGNHQDIKDWNINTTDSLDQAMSSKESPHMQMLAFQMPSQLMTPTVGPHDVMYTGVDFPAVTDLHDHNELPRDIYSFVDLSSMDNDVYVQSSTPDDALSVAHSSHTEDGHFISSHEPWNTMLPDGYPGTTLDQLSSSIFQTVPVSPPLTEASNDLSVTSSCSHPGFPSYLAPDDTLIGDYITSPMAAHGINPAEPLFPTPLSEKDPNRTMRPSKPARRGTLPNGSQPQVKQESELFPPLREPTRQRSKEGSESRSPREHPYYSMPTQSDGKYYCPFASGDKPCNHPATTQKCAYQQYLDSHLKPYRCKVPACVDTQLRFSSNACLFRHEREAHGLHGHGDNPHLCLWEGCERSVSGNGFPRRWNLYDHMRRVHDYQSSERLSSPETSPTAVPAKKKEAASRKRRGVTGPTPAPTMKRTRSVHSHGPAKANQATVQYGQRLQNAERNFYQCHARLLEHVGKMTPQDISAHEQVNATLNELFTLGLTYRQLDASHVSQMPHGLPLPA
ncbi:hypothetical protein N7481_012482 [Penicillium waksmanii]|uniref:uncharacterized protein n=1 Tax=Penicillium waksmanii TaxID=69791 RepID=UPI0025474609|nr:uncharacterized protein N7481_012482 [Penicillium waksmanii]KAJ5965768.1 hypothetical protein N7481_012482 [Penicillium waksmanii]